MEAKKILQASLLDILFEGRNKLYGAYELRNTYNRRVYKALAGMGVTCLLFYGSMLFANSGSTKTSSLYVSPDIDITGLKDEPKKIITPPPVKPKLPEVKVVKYTIPVIVKKDVPVDPPPPNDIVNETNIGKENINGKDEILAPSPLVEKGTTTLPINSTKENERSIFDPVQIEAKFPGGISAWQNFLQHNLRSDVPVENGAQPGRYTVVLSFTVDTEGNISDVKAENDPGYGTADEAVRVIKHSNKWIPALQNGRNVAYRQRQSITFIVDENG